ncbi:MAG: 30S ribosome-binding factor RbfA [Gammaproteobacteria bacterium]|jgi:ribosome-binding factor A
MPREYPRSRRLAGQIMRVLNELVRFESKDPALTGVSVTEVDLSRDLSIARVWFSVLDPDADVEAAAEGLRRASGFLRSRLGKELTVRHVPELRFEHDDSAERGLALTDLIDRSRDRSRSGD